MLASYADALWPRHAWGRNTWQAQRASAQEATAMQAKRTCAHKKSGQLFYFLSFFFPFQEVAGLSCTYSSCDQPIQILREELQEKIISSKSYSLKSHSWVGLKLQNSGLLQKRYLKPLARRLSSDWWASKPPSYWFYVLCIMTDEPASHWFSVRVYTTSDRSQFDWKTIHKNV